MATKKNMSSSGLAGLVSIIKSWGATSFLHKDEVEEVHTLAIDAAPIADSQNLITSGGVYDALSENITNVILVDQELPVIDKEITIPAASTSYGVTRYHSKYGISPDTDGTAKIVTASDTQIAEQTNQYRPITPSNINKAVKSAITGDHKLVLTESEKTDARSTIGAGTYSKPSSGIPASDLANGVLPTFTGDPDGNVYKINNSLISATVDGDMNDIVATYATKSQIPTNVSELTNDSGYLTLATLPIWNGGVS